MSDRAPRPLDSGLRAAMALRARPGGYAALLGAGVSRSSGVPTAWEVLEELVRRAAAASGEHDVGDPAAWWQARTGTPPTYPEVLAEVAATQDERRAVLAEFFERSEGGAEDGVKVPTAGHRALAQLAKAGLTRIFVTTNFDLLLEEALRDESMEPVVLSTPEAIAGMEPLHAQRCVVIHAHGDYLNPGVLNTEDELGSYPEPVARRVAQVFDEYGLMIVGWSASWDRALADLLQAAGPPRYASWWIEPADLNPNQLRLQVARSAEHVKSTADAALERIAEAIVALEDVASRSEPVVAAAAVAAAKRELARPAPAIRTHDRLRVEMERLAQCEAARPANFDGGSTERVRRIEGLVAESEVTLALVAALAYWGDPSTDRWWFGSIERLGQRLHVGGDTMLIHLTRAPATLVMYAAGVAAAAAERWDVVGRLLTEPRTETHTGGELLPVPLALPPDKVGLPGGAEQINRILWPLCVEHLGLDTASFVDGWERFEYLHHLVWTDACLRDVKGVFGGSLGWAPFLRTEGVGASENRASVELWFEAAVLGRDHPLVSEAWLLPRGNAENAQLEFRRAFADYVHKADWALLPPGGGMLPSGRHYPGRYDDDPHPRGAAGGG